MRIVHASALTSASVHEAQTLWCDTSRWPEFVDGLAEVIETSADWPQAGATVRWRSPPSGRGTVTERVTAHDPLAGIGLEIEDDQITGIQTVTFMPAGDQTELGIGLRYEIKRRSPLMPIVDLLFVRPAMRRSLQTTLGRFTTALTKQG